MLSANTEERRWTKGADGEVRLGRQLAKLPSPPWFVFHDLLLPDGEANVDHLVVGPAGVFTINTKNHAGRKVWVYATRIGVAGTKTNHLRDARTEARRVGALLRGAPATTAVRPVVAIYSRELQIKTRPTDVEVRDALHLRRWLTRQPAVFSEDESSALADFIRASWPTPMATGGDR